MLLVIIRGGVAGPAGPAGPALAGRLFSGSLPDCRDNLRTRRLVQVSTQTRLCPAYMRFSYNRSFACTYVMLNTYAYSNMRIPLHACSSSASQANPTHNPCLFFFCFVLFCFVFILTPPGGKRNNDWQHASSKVLSGIKMKSVSVSIK